MSKPEKMDFSDVIEGDKLTIKWDVVVKAIDDLDDYLNPSGSRKVHKVTCAIKSGPFKDREGTFIIFEDDKVLVHARPSRWVKLKDFFLGSPKAKGKGKH